MLSAFNTRCLVGIKKLKLRQQYGNHALANIYGTAQFKLDSTLVQHGLDMTHFSFHTHASMCVHTRLMTSNLPCKALVYALDVCTTVCRRMHVNIL